MPGWDTRADRAGWDDIGRSVLLTAFAGGPQAVVVCDQAGRFVAVNAAACQLLGYPREHIIGQPFRNFVHPADRAASLAAYFGSVAVAAVQAGLPPEPSRLRCLDSDGETVQATVRWTVSAPDPIGAQFGVVHLLDVSWPRQIDREFADAALRPSLAFQASHTGIALVDPDGRVVAANSELAETLGYRDTELTQRNVIDLVHPDDQATARSVLAQLTCDAIAVHDSVQRLLHRDGSVIQARRIAAPVRGTDDRVRYLILQIEDVSEAWQARAELPERAYPDPLTGLASGQDLAAELGAPGSPRAVVAVDVRNLALLNTTQGRARTDGVLVEISRRIKANCRHNDVVARLGGAQFVVLVRGHTGRGDDVADRLATAFDAPLPIADRDVHALVAVSNAGDPTGEQSLTDLLLQLRPTARAAVDPGADGPLAETGLAHPAAQQTRRLTLEADLAAALEAGQLTVVYQPVINLSSGRTTSVEALARWTHPALGSISPAEFIPVAETLGLINRLTQAVLAIACRNVAAWRDAHPEVPLTVAVNLSRHTLASPDLPSLVSGQLAIAQLPAEALVLEFTEAALHTGGDAARSNTYALRRLGVGLGIDDFGPEGDSYARLADTPASIVKLNRELLRTDTQPRTDLGRLREAIRLAASLSLTLVAEGVETEAQLELLRSLGCPHAQGFHLARPQTADAINRLLD